MAVEDIKVIKVVEHIERTSTQSLRVVLLEIKGEKKLAIQKYWRKSDTDEWLPGKGFHVDYEEASLLVSGIEKGIEEIE